MFERLDSVPPDPILGLIERFRDDPSPDKVDLGVGVYRDESGRTPIMAAVREAARLEVESSSSKAYFGQAGNPEINPVLQDLILGPDHPASIARRAITLQTPGGSGALRVAGELLVEANPDVRMWVPSPTWANHVPLLGSAGIQLKAYPYYEGAIVARDAMLGTLETAQEGDVILVHGSCHNPTGADLSTEDFRALASIAMARRIPVLVDNAYQGFAQGLEEDAVGARILVEAGLEVLICTSFSKNFGLYRDRAGSLTLTGPSSQTTDAAYANALRLVRRMYSVPPDHGPSLVSRVLTTPGLRQRWETELDHMRTRLSSLRAKLVGALHDRGRADFDFIAGQRGMFSLLGIDEATATSLVEHHHVYLPSNGRINVAGISDANVERVAEAIVAVTAKN
ncbi:MAG: amino acid aminotransferase [Acidimicrobiia bacterium]